MQWNYEKPIKQLRYELSVARDCYTEAHNYIQTLIDGCEMFSQKWDEHPEDWEGPCMCQACARKDAPDEE